MNNRIEGEPGPHPVNPWAEQTPLAPVREPALKLPWPPAAIALVLITLYGAQSILADPNAVAGRFGFIPLGFLQGGWTGLFTAMFVHGSWGHVLVNSAFCVAFGTPVARRFGLSALGGGLFLLFFLVCGVMGNFAFAVVHPHGGQAVVGASGAIAGLYGAMSRMLPGPRLAPLTNRTVVVMGAAWITINLFVGLLGIDAGLGAAGAPVAWEAHIGGYLAGILLIGLFDRAAPGPRYVR